MLLEKLKSDIYNIEPVKTIEVDTGIKRAYFDRKKSSYNQLLESKMFNNNICLLSTYKVYKVMVFNNNDYELLINNLLDDIYVISGEGGSYKGINHYCILVANKDGDKGILVDPQGYDYCRYTGIIEKEELYNILNKVRA